MNRDLKKRIAEWKTKIGRNEAEIRLKNEGLSLSIIQKLLGGSYPHQPGGLQLRAIEKAMEAK